MATNTITKIGIKNTSGSGYDTREIGAKGENIDIGLNGTGQVVTAASGATVSPLTTVLRTIQDNTTGAAPKVHSWNTNDDKYGKASTTSYGHVKIGNGLTVVGDAAASDYGATKVVYGTDANTACQGNDARLSNARKNPNAVTFSTGTSSPTTVDYDGSSAKTITYSTVGAAPAAHPDVAATGTVLGHVKTSTGLINNSGTISVSYGDTAGTACQGDDDRLSDARIPKAHASTATTYGAGDATNYGHVKLSDNYTSIVSTNTAANSVAASANALQRAYNTLNSNLSKKFGNTIERKSFYAFTKTTITANQNKTGKLLRTGGYELSGYTPISLGYTVEGDTGTASINVYRLRFNWDSTNGHYIDWGIKETTGAKITNVYLQITVIYIKNS